MKSNWIHSRNYDLLWIVGPPYFILAIVLLFHEHLEMVQDQFSFLTWLFIIVFIDVAHVYASVFRTYFSKEKRQQHKKLLLIIPLLCLIISYSLYAIDPMVFWTTLAYVAVFHFIRQQYGFMRLYARKDQPRLIDTISIYNATLFPMIYWFMHPNRAFNWFMDNEFLQFESPNIMLVVTAIYLIIIAVYLIQLIKDWKTMNIQKHLIIVGTYLSWYFGIVHFNNELIFTLLNVISHGLPYMALVFAKDFRFVRWPKLKSKPIFNYLVVFITLLLGFAVLEEFLWEEFIWKEHIHFTAVQFNKWIFVPLFALPQFTHYLLDAFIWRKHY